MFLSKVRYETKLTLVLGATFGLVFFDRNALNFLMPFIQKEMDFNNSQVGLLAGGLSLSWAISGIVVGRMSDTMGGRKAILVGAVFIFSLMSFSTGLAGSFLTLLVARLVMGLSEGAVLPISQTLIAIESSPERRGLNMGLMQNVLSNLMGSLVAPIALVAMAVWMGWRSAFYVTVVPGLMLVALLVLVVKEPRPNACNLCSEGRSVERSESAAANARGLLTNRNVVLCMIVGSLLVGWMINGWVFLPLYFTQVAKLSAPQMSIIMSALGGAGAVAGFVVPALSDRFGRRPVLFLFAFLGVVSPLSALYLAGSLGALVVAISIGWMAGGTFSIFMATIPSESVPLHMTATAMGLVMGSSELFGGFMAPMVVGRLADAFGLESTLIAEATFAALAGLISFGIRETAPSAVAREHKDVSTRTT